MQARRKTIARFVVGAVSAATWGLTLPASAAPRSLCVEAEAGCFDFVYVTVRMGPGDVPVVGAQFAIEYDPSILDLVDIDPGTECDAGSPDPSPFSLQVYSDVDETEGRIFYAVGVNRFLGDSSVWGAATLACLRFIPRGEGVDEVCLVDLGSPQAIILSDDFGNAVPVSNAQDCPTEQTWPAVACAPVEVNVNCVCDPGSADCSALATDCRSSVCNPKTGRCDVSPFNEGGGCDDADACTTRDVCVDGDCVGFDCRNPSLCVVSDADCAVPSDEGVVRIVVGNGDPSVIGAQLLLNYDPSATELVDVRPGRACDPASPFSVEVLSQVNETAGEIFYVVGVPPGEPGSQGPATLACLTLRVVGQSPEPVCVVEGVNPRLTVLADSSGRTVPISNSQDCPGAVRPDLSCEEPCKVIPTVSAWGLVNLALLLLTAGKVAYRRRGRGVRPW